MKTKIQIFVMGALLLASCQKKEVKEEAIRSVFYQEVGKTSTLNIRSFSGITQAITESRLSFKLGGLIEQIAVEMGDTVKSGAVIARLDSTDHHINYTKSIASLKSAEAQLTASKSAFVRIENLYVNNNVSLSEYEKAKMQFESAEMLVKTARSQLAAAQNQLNYTILRAPFDGVVTSVMAKENEMTGTGQPIAIFSSINSLEVRTSVPENVIRQISRGQEVIVRFSLFPEANSSGIITEVSPGIPNASAYPVVVRLTRQAKGLLPGMTGTVIIPLKETGRELPLIVPHDAVSHDQNGDFVYVVRTTEDADIFRAERKEVTLGRLGSDGFEIIEGLKAGEMVITAGIRFLYNGRKVKLLDDNNL